MVLAGNTTTERMEQLVLLTRRLCDLMEQEAEFFKARRPQDAAEITQEKGRLANIYRLECLDIERNPSLLDDIPADLRATLTAETKRFQNTLNSSETTIEAARTVTEGLVHAIAEEVAKTRTKHTGYGPNAQLDQNARANVGVTIDKSA